jgi:ABC-2 type transport system permease protein
MTRQIWGLLALQFTLTLRSWSHGKTIAAFLGLAVFLLLCAFSTALSLGLWSLGAKLLPTLDPLRTLAFFDALVLTFLLITLWGFLVDLQRNDLLDLRKLMHLAVSPALVFTINYLYSLLSPAILFFLPGSIALTLGLHTAHIPGAWRILPLAAAFYFMASAWTYHLRGWLAILLQSRRARRALAVLIPAIVLPLSQLPTIINIIAPGSRVEDWQRLLDDPLWAQRIEQASALLPPLWLGIGARAAIAGDPRLVWAATTGMLLAAAAGLLLGYRATLRYYRSGGAASGGGTATRTRHRTPLTARRLPFLSTDTTTMTLAFLLDYARHPAVRSHLIMPPIMTIVICASAMARAKVGGTTWASTTPMVVLMLPFLGSSMLLFNIFGTDIRAFRALVLLPTPRHRILLAKNLALFPFVGLMCVAVLSIAALLTGAPPRALALQLAHIPAVYALYCVAGNFLSVFSPASLSRDALRGQGGRLLLMLRGLAYALLSALLLAPTMSLLTIDAYAHQGYTGLDGLALWGTAALLPATLILYRATLTYTGDLLTTREQRILAKLTRETP